MLDRGLFDAATWMELLAAQNRITDEDRDSISRFLLMDLWRERENSVFLFTADFETSLSREQYGKLTTKKGRAMNQQFLTNLLDAYKRIGETHADQFPHLFRVDTSFVAGKSPSFQRIAYVVTSKVLDVIFDLTSQNLLVTDPVTFDGFVRESAIIQTTAKTISDHPRFLQRSEAERSLAVQQVVPYAMLRNDEGKFFWAKRRTEGVRSELAGKFTLLVGGHAEKRDANGGDISRVFERCLRRELNEELMGFMIQEITPLGFIHDIRNKAGSHHLAYIHEVRIGGNTTIRRQASDQEFGREPVEWKTPEEIADRANELDPWSQLVAKELFGASIADEAPTLFGRK